MSDKPTPRTDALWKQISDVEPQNDVEKKLRDHAKDLECKNAELRDRLAQKERAAAAWQEVSAQHLKQLATAEARAIARCAAHLDSLRFRTGGGGYFAEQMLRQFGRLNK